MSKKELLYIEITLDITGGTLGYVLSSIIHNLIKYGEMNFYFSVYGWLISIIMTILITSIGKKVI